MDSVALMAQYMDHKSSSSSKGICPFASVRGQPRTHAKMRLAEIHGTSKSIMSVKTILVFCLAPFQELKHAQIRRARM
jgi:hypothetical protein